MPLRKARSSFKLLPLSGSYYGGKEAMLNFIQQNRFVCVCVCVYVCVCMTSKLFTQQKDLVHTNRDVGARRASHAKIGRVER